MDRVWTGLDTALYKHAMIESQKKIGRKGPLIIRCPSQSSTNYKMLGEIAQGLVQLRSEVL